MRSLGCRTVGQFLHITACTTMKQWGLDSSPGLSDPEAYPLATKLPLPSGRSPGPCVLCLVAWLVGDLHGQLQASLGPAPAFKQAAGKASTPGMMLQVLVRGPGWVRPDSWPFCSNAAFCAPGTGQAPRAVTEQPPGTDRIPAFPWPRGRDGNRLPPAGGGWSPLWRSGWLWSAALRSPGAGSEQPLADGFSRGHF